MNNLTLVEFVNSLEKLNTANSSVLENMYPIFLPVKRIDKTNLYKKFIKNNQVLELYNNNNTIISVRERLVGQTHKDILETLLTMPKHFKQKGTNFYVKTTLYNLLKRMDKAPTNRKWVDEKIKELKGITISIKHQEQEFIFGIINTIKIDKSNGQEDYVIEFTPEYTYFLALNDMLNYTKLLPHIISIQKECKEIQKELPLKRELNYNFIKFLVRYMIKNNGNNNQISISNFLANTGLDTIMGKKELKEALVDIKRPLVIERILSKFGISLTNQTNTITYNSNNNYFIKKTDPYNIPK